MYAECGKVVAHIKCSSRFWIIGLMIFREYVTWNRFGIIIISMVTEGESSVWELAFSRPHPSLQSDLISKQTLNPKP